MATAVVVVQRDSHYWQWFARTLSAKLAALALLLFSAGDAHVLPDRWSTLCMRIGFAVGAIFGVHFAATAQPPRVPLSPGERAALDVAQGLSPPSPPSVTTTWPEAPAPFSPTPNEGSK